MFQVGHVTRLTMDCMNIYEVHEAFASLLLAWAKVCNSLYCRVVLDVLLVKNTSTLTWFSGFVFVSVSGRFVYQIAQNVCCIVRKYLSFITYSQSVT